MGSKCRAGGTAWGRPCSSLVADIDELVGPPQPEALGSVCDLGPQVLHAGDTSSPGHTVVSAEPGGVDMKFRATIRYWRPNVQSDWRSANEHSAHPTALASQLLR